MIYGYNTVSIIGNDVNYRDLVIVDDGSKKEIPKTPITWIQNPTICPSCYNSNCLTKYNYYRWYCVLCGWKDC